MYLALWRLLPGPLWLRIANAVAVSSAVVLLLMFVIYPWVAQVLPEPGSTVS